MPGYAGRDLLLKIGNGGSPETFSTIGAARTVALTLNNQPVEATTMDANGAEGLSAAAGVQSLAVALDGLFKDAAAEETLRQRAFSGAACNCQLLFPNGDVIAGAFVVGDYHRSGPYDGLEGFSVTLHRTGASSFTPGA